MREPGDRSGSHQTLALVDCLLTGVAQRSYDQAVEALEKIHAVVWTRHVTVRAVAPPG